MPVLSLEVAVHSDQHRRLISIDIDIAIKDANNECQFANKVGIKRTRNSSARASITLVIER
jgi:hypothetical protein